LFLLSYPFKPLATVVQGKSSQEAIMIRRNHLLHYRLVQNAGVNAASIATALLIGYLVLWARL
jgi:hypothetical protein